MNSALIFSEPPPHSCFACVVSAMCALFVCALQLPSGWVEFAQAAVSNGFCASAAQ